VTQGVDGFVVVDKPAGVTSHDVVAALRRASAIKRCGHAGTLDPMATGVVVAALGRATRLIRFVQDRPKEYLAVARFGEVTDTLDADGAVLAREPMQVTVEQVREVSKRFRGQIMQVPPMVSALKVGGRRLYELAREGTEVERLPRRVEVHELEILEVGPPPYPEVSFRVVCGKGTYVRSLADDMARALGGFAHLVSLRRTRVGGLGLDRAVPLDRLASEWRSALLAPAEALAPMPVIPAPAEVASAASHGVVFAVSPAPEVAAGEPFCLVGSDGELVAVYVSRPPGARPEVVLAP
jgi:tRNA pseudouridine55 synthase